MELQRRVAQETGVAGAGQIRRDPGTTVSSRSKEEIERESALRYREVVINLNKTLDRDIERALRLG